MSKTAQRPANEKPQPSGGMTVGQKHRVVGNDIPDESKERHTEIAVEQGEKLREKHEKQRFNTSARGRGGRL